ncbi:MAG TPA: serine/threonine-protein kinase [Phycisphaerales bacterium]|nr:serine/threonine-protein kinase [Phycisphaerales bacterium]HMP37790.1 serine/threonine-protein kinase [Phycisphaerales bacterium]
MTRRVDEIFAEALALSGEQRASYLRHACGDDAALLRKLEMLLRADLEAVEFLVEPPDADGLDEPDELDKPRQPVDPDTTRVSAAAGESAGQRIGPYRLLERIGAGESAGQWIGPYRLLERIGEGGFGWVWMAEQREPIRRRVALKIIKLGMDTKQVIARFEAERQALAMMDHPNIARVLDAGATDAGRPYFVMELVRGMPIVQFCDEQRMDTEMRVALFLQVCGAIQHAHQKGIIHRDIKPSNVLVMWHGDEPSAKVIDFGIAKATGAELTQRTHFTEHRQVIGTPAYMSPEQTARGGIDVDTRSDVYSLGVLLYELLTGTTPFLVDDLMSKGFEEMMRTIREQDPPKPSTRLLTLAESGTRTASLRRTDTRRLRSALRGDLDWIVMKCLEKERGRRYETANALAADLRRHLAREPVVAAPPSRAYRLRRGIQRHKVPVALGTVIACLLVLGTVGTTVGMARAITEKSRSDTLAAAAMAAETEAVASEAAARAAAERAERAAAQAMAEAQTSRAVTNFALGMIGMTNPDLSRTARLSVIEMLDRVGESIDSSLLGQPSAEAALRTALAYAYNVRGHADTAYVHIERAMELIDRHPEVPLETRVEALLTRLNVRMILGEAWREAVPEIVDALQKYVFLKRPEFRAPMLEMRWLSRTGASPEEGVRLLETIIALADALADEDELVHRHVTNLIFAAGVKWYWVRQREPAAACLKEAVERYRRLYGEHSTYAIHAATTYGEMLMVSGDSDGAHAVLEPLARHATETLADDHILGHMAMLFMGQNLYSMGREDEAEAAIRGALERFRLLAAPHLYGRVLSNSVLTDLYERQGRLDRADELREDFARGLAGMRDLTWLPSAAARALPPDRRLMFEVKPLVAQPERDVVEHVAAIMDQWRSLPAGAPATAVAGAYVIMSLTFIDPYPAFAREIFDEVSAEMRQNPHLHEVWIARAAWHHVRCALPALVESGDVDALALAREAYETKRRVYGSGSPRVVRAQRLLGQCLVRFGRPDEAMPHLTAAHERTMVVPGPRHVDAARSFVDLVELHELTSEPERAIALAREHGRTLVEQSASALPVWRHLGTELPKLGGLPLELHELALRAADRAALAEPTAPHVAVARGASLFRLGQLAEAVAALREVDADTDASPDADTDATLRWGILALAEHELGNLDSATEALRHIRASPCPADDWLGRRFVKEVDAAIGHLLGD